MEIVLKTSAVSIVTVPVGRKMLTHERRNFLVLFRASFFCSNEMDKTDKADFDGIINEFASIRARTVLF